jgi:hypothetical protein
METNLQSKSPRVEMDWRSDELHGGYILVGPKHTVFARIYWTGEQHGWHWLAYRIPHREGFTSDQAVAQRLCEDQWNA